MDNIVSAPKTDMFRIRVNPEVRRKLEEVYAKNGLTLTDAVNVFFQQSINAGGFPFPVTEENAAVIKAKAMSRLVKELQKGDECSVSYSEAEARKMLGLDI
ncbi:MAG: type II toxin-antitoxin system RelB/DinJ family antitoxin [Oscillospiraceae bacterium]